MTERFLADDAAVDIGADRSDIDAAIAALCESLPQMDDSLRAAVCYSLRGPGKRLRGILVCASYRAAGGGGDVSGLAAAVEMLHAYSLAHDDLPCMDNDDMRRGRPATHRVSGVAVTVVAGAAMIPLAVRAAAQSVGNMHRGSSRVVPIVSALMQAAGARGMIGGQLQDLNAEATPADSVEGLEWIHRAKTGALIAAAARVGGIAAGADDGAVQALGSFGADIGLAFQIVDDVLDVTQSSEQLGKTAGKDVASDKATWPAVYGIEQSRKDAQRLIAEAFSQLDQYGDRADGLRTLAKYLVERSH